jgi:hypothetical protein
MEVFWPESARYCGRPKRKAQYVVPKVLDNN